jgi:hypothetical protein
MKTERVDGVHILYVRLFDTVTFECKIAFGAKELDTDTALNRRNRIPFACVSYKIPFGIHSIALVMCFNPDMRSSAGIDMFLVSYTKILRCASPTTSLCPLTDAQNTFCGTESVSVSGTLIRGSQNLSVLSQLPVTTLPVLHIRTSFERDYSLD